LRSRYSVSDLHYVPDGVKESLLRSPDMSQIFRDKYHVYDPFVVYVGRLHPLKGIDILIKAMALVTKEMREAKAVIMGPGDQRSYKQLTTKLGLDKAVVFTGYVEEDMKIAAIDASSALILPSISNYVEVYPMVISEAWARGKPVIASAVGGIPYRVRNMVNGVLVQPRDPKALANAIAMLLSDEGLAKKLGERGRGEVKAWGEIAREVLRLYVE
ncbi:MAG: glycosyltransferase family 4 protein, partial [Desulfurococcus sp.]